MYIINITNGLKYKRRRIRRRRIAPTRRIRRDKKIKLKRREEREENNKKKRSKNYRKEKLKKLGRMVAPVHNFLPPNYCRSSEAAMDRAGGKWTSYFIASVVLWKEKSP
jgi:hypothetical protein